MGRQMMNKMRRNHSDIGKKNYGFCDLAGKCQAHNEINEARYECTLYRSNKQATPLHGRNSPCHGFVCTETGETKRKIFSGIEVCATPLGCCPWRHTFVKPLQLPRKTWVSHTVFANEYVQQMFLKPSNFYKANPLPESLYR